MPGINGKLAKGQRLLIWVWYSNCPKDTPAFNEDMTDFNGYTHRNTLPAGNTKPETWQKQKNHASRVLNPPFLELVNKTVEPFISTVNDCASTKASFIDGKLLLVGEALTLLRPHTGMSFNQAAVNCLRLQRALKGEMSMVQWGREVLQYAEKTRLLSVCVETYFQLRLLSSTFVLSMIYDISLRYYARPCSVYGDLFMPGHDFAFSRLATKARSAHYCWRSGNS